MAEAEAEGEIHPPARPLARVLTTAAGTRAGISDRVQHLHQFSDSFVPRYSLGRILPSDFAGALARMRAGWSCIQPCSSHSRMAPAFRSTVIAQPLSVPIGSSLNVSTVIAPRATSQLRSGRQRPGAQRQS